MDNSARLAHIEKEIERCRAIIADMEQSEGRSDPLGAKYRAIFADLLERRIRQRDELLADMIAVIVRRPPT